MYNKFTSEIKCVCVCVCVCVSIMSVLCLLPSLVQNNTSKQITHNANVLPQTIKNSRIDILDYSEKWE